MYRKITIETNEYTKIDRWAKIKSKSEEIARVAQIALNLDTSAEEARLVEEIVLNLLREIRILREEQGRDPRGPPFPTSISPPVPSSSSIPSSSIPSQPPLSPSMSTTTITTTPSFRGSGGSNESDTSTDNTDDITNSNILYDKDNPSLLSSLSHLSTSQSPAIKVLQPTALTTATSILSEHYNPQYIHPSYPSQFLPQFSNYLQDPSILQLATQTLQAPQFSSSISPYPNLASLQTNPARSPPLPPAQHDPQLHLLSSQSKPAPSLPQPQLQKKRKSERKPP